MSILNFIDPNVRVAHYGTNEYKNGNDIVAEAERIKSSLKGIKTIVLSEDNGIEWVEFYLAAMSMPLTLVVVDPLTDPNLVTEIVKKYNPDLFVSTRVEGAISLKGFLKKANTSTTNKNYEGEATLVMYTSGTSGKHNGVVMSCAQVIKNIFSSNEKLKIGDGDVFFHTVPFSHSMGHLILLCCLFSSSTLIINTDSSMTFHGLLHSSSNITVVPPVVLKGCINSELLINKLSGYRAIITGGAPLERALYDKLSNMGLRIYNGYGATECVCGIAIADTYKSPCYGAVEPLSWANIKIAESGEILVRGDCVCQMYDNNKVIAKDGYYHTKDVGEFDSAGRLFIHCRLDDIIVMDNGYKFKKNEIESKIESLPFIAGCLIEKTEGGSGITIYLAKTRNSRSSEDEQIILNLIAKQIKVDKITYVDNLYNERGKKVKQ